MQRVTVGGITVFRSALLEQFPEFGHAFSTRVGGTSAGPHASLNLSSATGDERERVVENRRRLCEALGVEVSRLSIPRQVLGHEIARLETGWIGGVTAAGADGLIADQRGVPTLTLSADCVLTVIYDPKHRAFANVHSSRHGALGQINVRAIEQLRAHFGTDPADLVAAIAPSIGPCCYEVREDVAGEWRARHGERHLLRQGERTVLDLWGAIRDQFEHAGVRPDRIDLAGVCTRCHPELFFSYRRDGERTGRFGSLAWLW